MAERLFTVFDQHLVEVVIGAHHGHASDRLGKCNLIRVGTERDAASQKLIELRTIFTPAMHELDAARQQALARELPAGADQCGHPAFDLMPVGMPRNAEIIENQRNVVPLDTAQRDRLIRDRAVARHSLQGVAQHFRGRQDIIEQAGLSQVELPAQVKSQEVVLQGVRRQLDKPDLILGVDASAAILDLSAGQTRLVQQRLQVDSCRTRARAGEPRHQACGARERAELLGLGIAHERQSTLMPRINLSASRPGTYKQIFGTQ
jgi:hypothetical protein